MAKVRNENKGNETIPRNLIFDKGLSDRARFVYCYMSAKPEEWDFVLAPMAKELGYSVDTLRKYLGELIKSGWITKGEQRHDEVTNKFGCNEYTINNKPVRVGEPYRKKPDTGKTRDGKIPTQEYNSSIDTPINDNSSINTSVIDKEERKRLSNDNQKKRFLKPSISEIEAYIKEKNFHFDAENFFDYYESKGWVVGRSPMKDWKAACRLWESKRKENLPQEQVDEIPADDIEIWDRNKSWMRDNTPRIASRISYKDFAKMRGMVMFKACVYAEILKDIEQSGYNGDIVKEFERLSDTEKYSKRITA